MARADRLFVERTGARRGTARRCRWRSRGPGGASGENFARPPWISGLVASRLDARYARGMLTMQPLCPRSPRTPSDPCASLVEVPLNQSVATGRWRRSSPSLTLRAGSGPGRSRTPRDAECGAPMPPWRLPPQAPAFVFGQGFSLGSGSGFAAFAASGGAAGAAPKVSRSPSSRRRALRRRHAPFAAHGSLSVLFTTISTCSQCASLRRPRGPRPKRPCAPRSVRRIRRRPSTTRARGRTTAKARRMRRRSAKRSSSPWCSCRRWRPR